MTIESSAMLANVGTPLMWASMFHLLIGNAIIGVGDAASGRGGYTPQWSSNA